MPGQGVVHIECALSLQGPMLASARSRREEYSIFRHRDDTGRGELVAT